MFVRFVYEYVIVREFILEYTVYVFQEGVFQNLVGHDGQGLIVFFIPQLFSFQSKFRNKFVVLVLELYTEVVVREFYAPADIIAVIFDGIFPGNRADYSGTGVVINHGIGIHNKNRRLRGFPDPCPSCYENYPVIDEVVKKV